MWAPHPAAFTTTWSTPANARRVPPRVLPRGAEVAVVRGERAATRLVVRDDDAPAVPREHPDRREVHAPEPEVLDAAGQERDRPADLARRLGDGGAGVPHDRPPRGINDRMRRGRKGRARGASAPASRVSVGDGRTTSRPSHRRNRAPARPVAARSASAPPPSSGRTARATGRRPRTRGRRGRDP